MSKHKPDVSQAPEHVLLTVEERWMLYNRYAARSTYAWIGKQLGIPPEEVFQRLEDALCRMFRAAYVDQQQYIKLRLPDSLIKGRRKKGG